jgi:hypothetical protein
VSRLHRAALHLYPRSFRREYGDELLRAARDLRTHAGASSTRVVARTAADIVRTAPRQRLEALMSTARNRTLVAALALTAIALVAFTGPIALVLVVGATVVIVRNQRDVDTGRWLTWLGAGAALLASTITYAVLEGEMETALTWTAWILTFMAGLVLTTAGVVLGGLRLAATRS